MGHTDTRWDRLDRGLRRLLWLVRVGMAVVVAMAVLVAYWTWQLLQRMP